MNKIEKLEKLHYYIFFGLVLVFIGLLIGISIPRNKAFVEAYDKGYEDGERDAVIDFMEDYYDVLIENAVLEERLKDQPKNETYIKQIVDDFELVIELQQYYYQENITTHSFGDWLQINYPELYRRIESYF